VAQAPRALALRAGIPNPFRTATTLGFDVPAPGGHARLEIFDVAGRRVTTLEHRWLPGGSHTARWNGTGDRGAGVAAGVYLCRLELEGAVRIRRLLRLE